QGDAAGADTDQDRAFQVAVALHDLVRHARKRAAQPLRVHQHVAHAEAGREAHATLPPSGTGRSGMRRMFSPLPLSAPSTMASASKPAMRRAGTLTIPITCRPTRSSGS